MADTAAGVLLDTMHEWGVEVLFGLPGDGINGLMEALRKRQDRIRFIQVRHEEAAAFMACGYARYTGRLGACLATSGPGGIHLVSALYDAKIDGLPVVALTGHHYHDMIGTYTQQDVDLDKLFQDVAVYSERVMGPAHAENVAHIACRDALGLRGVAHINIPTDIQDQKVERRSKENVPHHQSTALRPRATTPTEPELRRAAEVLNAGRRVALLCGPQARAAQDALLAIADTLAAPIISQGLGCAVIMEEIRSSAGCLGLLGPPAAQQALAQCDTLFLIGTAYPSSECAQLLDGVRVVQLAPDPMRLDSRCAIDAGLTGGLEPTLQALLPLLRHNEDRQFLDQAHQGLRDFTREAAEQIALHDGLLPPALLARELSQHLAAQSVLCSDPGTLSAAQADSQSELPAAIPSSLPYVIAAQLALPDHQCVAVVTEPSFSMLMAEFVTAVKYRLPIRVVVAQRAAEADGCHTDLAAFAQACGGAGYTLRSARECGEILDRAFAQKGPALIAAQLSAAA